MRVLIAILFISSVSLIGTAQTMTWIPSSLVGSGCQDAGNVKENIICFKLQYLPEKTGLLTSYTTGFWANCLNNSSAVVSNRSCIMNDNSNQLSACDKIGKTLINCSGNTGLNSSASVKKGVPVILHQICFQVTPGETVEITEDDLTDLTTSMDIENETASTFFPAYKTFSYKNSFSNVQVQTEEISSGSQNGNTLSSEQTPTMHQENAGLELFPNPAFDFINLKVISKQKTMEYSIYDMAGSCLLKADSNTNELIKLDISGYRSGVYHIFAKSDEKVFSKRFVVISQ